MLKYHDKTAYREKKVRNYYLKLSVLRYQMKIINNQSELRYHYHRRTHKEMRDSTPSVISKLVHQTTNRKRHVRECRQWIYHNKGSEHIRSKGELSLLLIENIRVAHFRRTKVLCIASCHQAINVHHIRSTQKSKTGKSRRFPKNKTTQVDFSQDHIFSNNYWNIYQWTQCYSKHAKSHQIQTNREGIHSNRSSPVIIKNTLHGLLKLLSWNITTKEHTMNKTPAITLKNQIHGYHTKIISIQKELRYNHYHHNRRTNKQMKDSRPSVNSQLVKVTKLWTENVT